MKTPNFKLMFAALAAAAIGLAPKAWATGELPGIFSVSATKKVQFSQGNLQAVFASAGSSCTWQFAANQYGYVGNAAANNAINGNGSVSATGTVDLFGWSTASTYYGINNSGDAVDYSGDFVDWGNLAISNGGNTENSGWRTLTRDEWAYLFTNHTYGYATVAGVKGIIIVPDNYSGPAIDSDHSNDTNPFARNTIDASTWASTYAPAGVVFLPAAGFRLSWIGQVQENAYYWSSTPVDGTNKYATLLGNPNNDEIITYSSGANWPANDGFSVRLVKNAPMASVTAAPTPVTGLTYTGSAQTLINAGTASGGTMNYSLDGSSWSTALPTGTDWGTYTVYYKAVGDAYHTDSESGTVTAIIGKAPSYGLTVGPWTFDAVITGWTGYEGAGTSISFNGLNDSKWTGNTYRYNDADGCGYAYLGTTTVDSKYAVYSTYTHTETVPAYTRKVLVWNYQLAGWTSSLPQTTALYAADNLAYLKTLPVDFTEDYSDAIHGSDNFYHIAHLVQQAQWGASTSTQTGWFDFDNRNGSTSADITDALLLTQVFGDATGMSNYAHNWGGFKDAGSSWITCYYKRITYDANGGDGSMSEQEIENSGTLRANAFTRYGYTFAGWATSPNGSVIYADEAAITVTESDKGPVTLYAQWVLQAEQCVGKVIAADGKLYKTVAAATNAGTTPSGVVAYWGAAGSVEASGSDYRGLAISLTDVATFIPWCTNPSGWFDSNTLAQALDARNGWERTDSFGRPGSRDYGSHDHQAAAAAYDYTVNRPTGASRWFVPTMGQWNLAVQGLTGSNADISETQKSEYSYYNLKTKFDAAGANPLTWCVYWSSTEVDGTYMWTFSIEGGDGSKALSVPKSLAAAEFVRAFFAFGSATLAEYVVSYDANGGSGAPSAQTKDGGIDLSLSSTEPTREGCAFAGWATSVNGEVAYQAGDTFTGNVDTTLYAQWEIVLDDETATVEPAADCGQGDSVAAIPVSVNIGEGISSKTGVTVRYELDQVTKSGEVVSEGATTESAGDLSIDLTSVVSNAYFKVAAVVKSTDGTGAKTKVASETTIGVLAVTNAPKTAIIGVPWKSLAGGDISVDKLVRTENLTKGDQIMVYDSSTGDYKAWALNEGKTWDEVATVTANESPMNPGAASATSVARGSGVWLTRQDPSQPIYLVGQFVDEAVKTDLEKPDEPGEQKWNLVASPKVEPVDVAILLNERQATDKVMVPSAGAPKNFIYNATLGKWGYIDYRTGEDGRVRAFFREDDTLIQPGTGFWYLNGDTTHDSLEW